MSHEIKENIFVRNSVNPTVKIIKGSIMTHVNSCRLIVC